MAKAVEARGQGGVLATAKAVEARGNGGVLATANAVETQGNGSVLATAKAVWKHDAKAVSSPRSGRPRSNPCPGPRSAPARRRRRSRRSCGTKEMINPGLSTHMPSLWLRGTWRGPARCSLV